MTEQFHWTSPSGVSLTIPRMKSIKAGVLRRHRNKSEIDFMFSLLEETLPSDELTKLDELDLGDLEACFTAWQRDEGATLPES